MIENWQTFRRAIPGINHALTKYSFRFSSYKNVPLSCSCHRVNSSTFHRAQTSTRNLLKLARTLIILFVIYLFSRLSYFDKLISVNIAVDILIPELCSQTSLPTKIFTTSLFRYLCSVHSTRLCRYLNRFTQVLDIFISFYLTCYTIHSSQNCSKNAKPVFGLRSKNMNLQFSRKWQQLLRWCGIGVVRNSSSKLHVHK